ncbi:hypothetical protein ACSJLL_25395, partial [Enterobacter kobei]
LLGAMLAVLAFVILLSQWKMSAANQAIAAAHERRLASVKLADELRQSSDDLTRLARTYVVTGDARWEAQYQEVLDI